MSVNCFKKSMNIWQSYKQERGCLIHSVHLANTVLKVNESARHHPPFARNYAKYSSILIFYWLTQQRATLNLVIENPTTH